MLSTSVDKIRETGLFKFDENTIPLSERFDIVDFKELEPVFDDSACIRIGVYTFLMVDHGEAEIEVDGITKIVKTGDLVCAIPGDVWIWKWSAAFRGKFVFFEAPFILAGLIGGYTLEPISYLNSDYHYPFINLSAKRYLKLRDLIADMEECHGEKPIFYDLLRAQLWQFIFLTEKEYIANGNSGRKTTSSNHLPVFVNLVNRHFRENQDVAFYAEKMNITTNYLNKIVRNALGHSAHDFIMNRVISEAKILLRLTDVSVNELAYSLGFSDPNYFIRVFKKWEGVSPKEYQKRGTL